MQDRQNLRGERNEGALERALNTIIERHESLRTHFEEIDGEPVQVIEPEMRITNSVEDLSGFDERAKSEYVLEALRAEGAKPFDLSRGPLLRVKLLKLNERDHVLLRTMHHITSDGWSEGIFNRELWELYDAYRQGRENPLKPLPMQYADFTLWQRQVIEDEKWLTREMAYWKRHLAGIPERLELPTDRPRPAVQTFEAELCRVKLSSEQCSTLKRLSQSN